MLVVWLLAALALGCGGRRHAPALREDEPARRNVRPAECQFGKQTKELGSTWFADLGPPFGVMYCIKCECIPVQKKRRVVAKVHCRNIKNECPEPTCDSPVLLPGRCCKTCPGDVNAPDVVQEDSPAVVVPTDEDEYSMKHFGAVLTGRSPLCIRRDDMTGVAAAPAVATARLVLHRRHLFWSVLLGPEAAPPPRALSFLDYSGRLLLEHPLKRQPGIHASYEENTNKLCGVWRRVPREYKRLLRESSLYVALIWGDESNNTMQTALSGAIHRYPALGSEMFTSLLQPELPLATAGVGPCETRAPGQEQGWWGGTAIVTGVTGAATSVHLTLVYNGVFSTAVAAAQNQAVKILLTMPDKNLTIIEEVQKVIKPSYEMNILEFSTPVSAAELRSLARDKVHLSIEAVGSPERRISGAVGQRATCEVYHAPLTGERAPASPVKEGLALLYIDKEGSLVYDIQMENLDIKDPKITLMEEQGKRHSQVEILDMMSGVLARPSVRVFPPLYDEQLTMNIGADSGPAVLRGRLLWRPVGDAAGAGPVLLRRGAARVPAASAAAPLAGLAWFTVDSLCGFNYEISIVNSGEEWNAWLVSSDDASARLLVGAEGSVVEPTAAELAAVQAGSALLELRAPDNSTVILSARLPQINVSSSCLPAPRDTETSAIYPPGDNSIQSVTSCFHGGNRYEDGSQWMITDSCEMCGCALGRARCEPVRCAPLECAARAVRPPGHCCPICTNTTLELWRDDEWCTLAGRRYSAGSSWHPYLVPGGYDTCAVCTCEASTRAVRCPRVRCPPLRCADREAYRPDKKACCRVCPEPKAKSEEDTPKDQEVPKTAKDILDEGGCNFTNGPIPNGKEVHPTIHSHGEDRCVVCHCKDGKLSCKKRKVCHAPCSKRGRRDPCCACRHSRRHKYSTAPFIPHTPHTSPP